MFWQMCSQSVHGQRGYKEDDLKHRVSCRSVLTLTSTQSENGSIFLHRRLKPQHTISHTTWRLQQLTAYLTPVFSLKGDLFWPGAVGWILTRFDYQGDFTRNKSNHTSHYKTDVLLKQLHHFLFTQFYISLSLSSVPILISPSPSLSVSRDHSIKHTHTHAGTHPRTHTHVLTFTGGPGGALL